MKIIFWQNVLSIHQIPYINQLSKFEDVNEVILISGEDLTNERKNMGWSNIGSDSTLNFRIIINPNNELIKTIYSSCVDDSWHLYSGIRSFEFVYNAFRIGLKYNIKRALITERPNTFAFGLCNGKPIWLHKIRFFLQDRKYAKYISKVFAMGDEAVNYFKSVYNKWEVIPFAYCTELKEVDSNVNLGTLNLCFVGSLSWWKSPESIMKAANLIKKEINISYIGRGNKESEIKKLSKYSDKIKLTLYGFKSNKEIPLILSNQDILILPSIYDGWGAVVNEAIQNGLYVICSDKCGAKELLKNTRIGIVFDSNDINELSEKINYCINNIERIRKDREYRIEWANSRISGNVIAQYMIDCLNDKKVERPWFK